MQPDADPIFSPDNHTVQLTGRKAVWHEMFHGRVKFSAPLGATSLGSAIAARRAAQRSRRNKPDQSEQPEQYDTSAQPEKPDQFEQVVPLDHPHQSNESETVSRPPSCGPGCFPRGSRLNMPTESVRRSLGPTNATSDLHVTGLADLIVLDKSQMHVDLCPDFSDNATICALNLSSTRPIEQVTRRNQSMLPTVLFVSPRHPLEHATHKYLNLSLLFKRLELSSTS